MNGGCHEDSLVTRGRWFNNKRCLWKNYAQIILIQQKQQAGDFIRILLDTLGKEQIE